jgi:hypothetical protein
MKTNFFIYKYISSSLNIVFTNVKKTNSTQKLKLLGEVLRYDLYYSLTHLSNESSLNLKLAQAHTTL